MHRLYSQSQDLQLGLLAIGLQSIGLSAHLPFTDICWISTHLWYFQNRTLWGEGFCRQPEFGARAWHLRPFGYTPLFRCFHFQEQRLPPPPLLSVPSGHPCEAAEVHRDIISDSHSFQQSVTGFYSRKKQYSLTNKPFAEQFKWHCKEWRYKPMSLFSFCSYSLRSS